MSKKLTNNIFKSIITLIRDVKKNVKKFEIFYIFKERRTYDINFYHTK